MTKKRRKTVGRRKNAEPRIQLPAKRRLPVNNPWAFAYLLTGEKKIGKTSFAIEGCEELVLQFDKPQMAYEVREMMIESWEQFSRVLTELERRSEADDWPWERIIIDGAGEWYTMCQTFVCKEFGIDHPSDEGYARAWHKLRDDFTEAVNRLLRLQSKHETGLVFIAHCEWKEKRTRHGLKIERLVPNLPSRCEEILNGKVDGWFVMDYVKNERIIVTQGDEITGAGHRIDGHFLTPDGRRVQEIPMGDSSSDALDAFIRAFNNEQTFVNLKERDGGTKRKKITKKKKSVSK